MNGTYTKDPEWQPTDEPIQPPLMKPGIVIDNVFRFESDVFPPIEPLRKSGTEQIGRWAKRDVYLLTEVGDKVNELVAAVNSLREEL